MLAWEPLNHLLDSVVRSYPLPLIISRLELLGPESGEVVTYCLLLPNSAGLQMGPLGGVVVEPLFVPADAIWREALVSSSPFYRLLCAFRLQYACDELRRIMRSTIRERNLDIKLPREPEGGWDISGALQVLAGMPFNTTSADLSNTAVITRPVQSVSVMEAMCPDDR